MIACFAIAALLGMSHVGSADAAEQSDQGPAREPCNDIYETPPAKIARPVQIILADKAANEAGRSVSDEDLDEYLDAHFSAETKIERWLTKHCLVCTTSEAPQPGATAVLQICPIGADGQLLDSFSLEDARKHGSCGQPSAKVESGLRCGAGNGIYDPCWPEIGAERSAVICMGAPWSHSVTRLLTKSREFVRRSEFEYSPWGVELEGGDKCVVYGSGAHSSVSPEGLAGPEADVIDYYCVDEDLVLLRDLDMSGQLWRIGAGLCDRDSGCVRTNDQTIVTAWFG